uniref:E3 SUMO-protein ligase PIAS4 n=1 Tax=Marmota marmota marmota TaxID=9994 RepID=A0A8C5ZT89_MARMA
AAAEKFESRNMVMSFRVSDLQMLLGFVGRSKSGLKHELVTRALQLVQFDCSPELFKKIKELYETRYAKKSAEPGPQPHRPLDPLTMHSAYDRASTVPRTPLSGPNIDYPVLYGKYLNGLGRLPTKTLKPEVRLVKLPFFNMLDELLKPTELVPQNSEKLQESPCIFALTPRQVELIRNSRELQPGVKAVQVVLRICYSDASCPQEDQYPPNIAVKVNHSYCSVPGYYPSNKPGVEPKRPCRPINLTHLMYLSSATNRITVTWGNYGKSYSVALYLVRQLTSAELLQRLRTIGVKHPELCKALVKEKLRLDPDSEIATTGVRVSLICPVSGWQVPALLPPRAAWPGHPPSPQVALVQLVWERRRAGPGWGPLGFLLSFFFFWFLHFSFFFFFLFFLLVCPTSYSPGGPHCPHPGPDLDLGRSTATGCCAHHHSGVPAVPRVPGHPRGRGRGPSCPMVRGSRGTALDTQGDTQAGPPASYIQWVWGFSFYFFAFFLLILEGGVGGGVRSSDWTGPLQGPSLGWPPLSHTGARTASPG